MRLRHEEGQGLVEYGLIIFMVILVVLGILLIGGGTSGTIFSAITGSL